MDGRLSKRLLTSILVAMVVSASFLVFVPNEVNATPTFGTPEIDPEYPNATEPVNVTIDIDDTQALTNATLYYSYDGVTWIPVDMNLSGGYAEPQIGIVQQDAWSDYQTLLNNLGLSYVLVPSNPTSSDLNGIDLLILDGASGGLSSSEIAVYQTFYDDGGTLWTSYDDISDYSWMSDFAALIGASSLSDTPDSQIITFTAVAFPNGAPTNVFGETLNFDQADQEYVTPNTCVVLDDSNEATILDGGNKYVLYLGDTIASVADLTSGGTLGKLFSAFYDMSGGGGAQAVIPGPGYSTWVYYYINATNQIGETNESMIHSFYADGTNPIVVNHTAGLNLLSTEGNVTIYANVTDDYYLDYTLLWYDNGSGWTSIMMNFTAGNSTNATYKGIIPPAESETTVQYYIEVFDKASNSNISITANYTTNFPPIITNVTYIPQYPNGTTIVTIYANVTDVDGVSSVTLYYSTDGTIYTLTSMSILSGDTYDGTIPATGSTTIVYYYINATDTNGLINSSPIFTYFVDADGPEFGTPSTQPEYPNATVDVNVTIGITDNVEVKNATLYYSYDGSTWYNTSMNDIGGGAGGISYEYDVESGPSGWIHYPLTGPAGDNWIISSARSMSPVNSWYSGPDQGSNWGDSCLESPLFINLPQYTNLSFWHWYDFFPGPTPVDGGIVEINNGSGWVQIFPVGGYDITLASGWQNPIEGLEAFTYTSGGWQQETFNLSAYEGKDIRIRFHVGWIDVDVGPEEGWYIDNITLFSDFGGWSATIPGPGYSTWVYYYAFAIDQANNTNISNTYSYYVDGVPPAVVDTSGISSPVASDARVSIFANVTDDYGFDFNSVYLWYNNGSGWTSVPMNFVSGNYTNATFQAYIPPANAETTVFYYVEVMDNASNANVSITKNYLTNLPPFIENVTNVPEYPNGTTAVTVYANITDSDGISSATLYYSTDGITYTPTSMNIFSGDIYNGTIPAIGSTTIVYYYISATDTNGFSNSSPIFTYFVDAEPPDFGTPGIDPEYPNATVDVNVTIDITDNIEVKNATLFYSYDGITWYNTSMNSTGGPGVGGNFYEYDVESGPSGWTHYQLAGSAGDNWVISSARSLSPVNSWYSGQEPGANWGDSCLESPLFTNLPPFTTLTFWHWYEFYPSFQIDGGIVEINNGTGWVQITPIGGYDTTLASGYQNPLEGLDAFTFTSGGWQQETFNLSAYAGEDIRIRFHVGWNNVNDGPREGWYIDNVTLYSDFGGWESLIPGPGYSTWVYYYVNATDQANNTNTSNIYSYYVDGNPPTVVDTSDITVPVATNAQVSIFANITDDYGFNFNSVYLWYDNGSGWASVQMNFVSGNYTNATFQAYIPAANAETTVVYYVKVMDNASNANISTTKNYLTNSPPIIENVIHLPEYPNGTSTVTVYANITDIDGISSATLYYSTDGTTYTPTSMSIFSGDVYNGTIPASGSITTVYYYINATDTNGFLNSSPIFTYFIDTEGPELGTPAINPKYPNSTEDVEIAVNIVDDIGIANATLWYSYDGVNWFSTTMNITSDGGASERLFNESFLSTTLDPSKWASTTRTPTINTLGINEPSSPYSLELAGGDAVTSVVIDLSSYTNVSINFSYEMGGGGESPDPIDWLYLEYYNDVGVWVTLWSQNGDSTNHNTFDQVEIFLPNDAYHSGFQFRLRNAGGLDIDDFYLDDIHLLTLINSRGIISGPGYPAEVYYYINATDTVGNSVESMIYSYLAGSDLSIEARNITFEPLSPIENGTAILINATIYNSGGSLVDVEVRFYDGNPDVNNDNIIDAGAREIGSPAVIDIQANSVAFASTIWTPPIRAFYDIYVWADAMNATWEVNEWNNLASNTLDVYDWLDDFLNETKIDYKYNITINNSDAALENIGGSISVTGTSYYSNVGGWNYDYFAQSFKATGTRISSVGLYIGGDSSPYPDMRVQLWGDISGNPDKNNIIASGDVISGSTITFAGQRYYINFSSPISVTIGQSYWVVIDGYYDHNTSGDCKAKYNSGNVYTDGIFKRSNDVGASWFTPSNNYDLDFIVVFYEPVLDGNLKSIEITLPLGKIWETLYINKTEPTNMYINISVVDGTTNNPIPGFTDLTENIIDISSIDPEQYPSIKLVAYLIGDGITTPALHYWAINWVPSPRADAGPDDFVDEDIPYTFNGSGSWSSVEIANYAWDMNASDGIDWTSPDYEGSDLRNPTHIYYSPGVYLVTLNVTDINGYWDIDTMLLIVNDTTPPIVDAGSDDVTDEDSPYTFDASGSWDNSGTIASYLWDIDEHDGIDWNNPDHTGVSPIHTYFEPGTYIVTLNVSDTAGNYNVTNITITVRDITSPVTDAGLDGSIDEDNEYCFNGSSSTDNVGIVFYNWTFGDGGYDFGPNVTTSHTYASEGRYIVILKITDEAGNWDEDTLTIYVNNVAPVADAGENQTVNESEIVIFDGSGSWDTPSDMPFLTFIWYFGDGFVGAGKVTTHIFTAPGIYTVTLIVNDDNGAMSSDTITITVKDASSPIANAGDDDTVDQNSAYTFDGSESFDNVGIANYAWDMDASDGIDWENPDYSGPNMWNPVHTYVEPGVYVVTLNVTDTSGYWDLDTMVLTVTDTIPPVADAGQDDLVDQNVPYKFNGGGSTDNVGIATYLWDIDSSNGIDWSSPDYIGASPMHVYTESGVYVVCLSVIDSDGNSNIDTVTITVNKTIGDDTVPSAPTDVEVLLLPRNDALNIRWHAPTTNKDGSLLTDLDHYEIFYRAGENQEYKKLSDVAAGTTSYIHSGLTTNAIYYYYVVAVDTSSTRSQPSMTVSGMPNVDTDGDQIPDITDEDDDNDDHPDSKDDYPLDSTKWKKAEPGFDWLWILLGLIIVLLCIIGLLIGKRYRKGEEGPQEALPGVASEAPVEEPQESLGGLQEESSVEPFEELVEEPQESLEELQEESPVELSEEPTEDTKTETDVEDDKVEKKAAERPAAGTMIKKKKKLKRKKLKVKKASGSADKKDLVSDMEKQSYEEREKKERSEKLIEENIKEVTWVIDDN